MSKNEIDLHTCSRGCENPIQNRGQQTFCERCEKDSDEISMCEKCEMMICRECSATYNQFTQIDYTCCKQCVNNNDYEQ